MKFLLKENETNRSQGNGNKILTVAGKNNLMAPPHKYHLKGKIVVLRHNRIVASKKHC